MDMSDQNVLKLVLLHFWHDSIFFLKIEISFYDVWHYYNNLLALCLDLQDTRFTTFKKSYYQLLIIIFWILNFIINLEK
jgi:hypothetical protein